MLRSSLIITILENTERARLLPSIVKSGYARLSREASKTRHSTLLFEVLESPIGNVTCYHVTIALTESTLLSSLFIILTRELWNRFMKSDWKSTHYTLQVQRPPRA